MLLSTLLFSERVVTKNGNDGRTSAPIRNVSIRRPGTQVSARLGVTATSACCISGLMNRAISITSCTMKKQRCSSLASSRTVTDAKSSLQQAFPPGPHGGTCLNNYLGPTYLTNHPTDHLQYSNNIVAKTDPTAPRTIVIIVDKIRVKTGLLFTKSKI